MAPQIFGPVCGPISMQCLRHILGNGIPGNQQITPQLSTMAHCMTCGVTTPLHCGVFLGLELGIMHVIVSFDFQNNGPAKSSCSMVTMASMIVVRESSVREG
jgi:hypothetical protein